MYCKVVTVEADNSQQVSQSTVKIEPSQLEKLDSVNNITPSQNNRQFSIKLEASQIGSLESVNNVWSSQKDPSQKCESPQTSQNIKEPISQALSTGLTPPNLASGDAASSVSSQFYSPKNSSAQEFFSQTESQPSPPAERQNVDFADVFGDGLDVFERAQETKIVNTPNYDREWKHFCKWLGEQGHRWGVELDNILTNSLSAAGMDYLLSEYLSNRYNMTVWRQEGVIVRLDPNTVGPVFSSLISVIEQKTDYRPGTDPDFRLFKANKKHYMQQGKKVDIF